MDLVGAMGAGKYSQKCGSIYLPTVVGLVSGGARTIFSATTGSFSSSISGPSAPWCERICWLYTHAAIVDGVVPKDMAMP